MLFRSDIGEVIRTYSICTTYLAKAMIFVTGTFICKNSYMFLDVHFLLQQIMVNKTAYAVG